MTPIHMEPTCTNCATTIEETAVRYEQTGSDGVDQFCSLNCLAETDRFDERRVREQLFDDEAAPTPD